MSNLHFLVSDQNQFLKPTSQALRLQIVLPNFQHKGLFITSGTHASKPGYIPPHLGSGPLENRAWCTVYVLPLLLPGQQEPEGKGGRETVKERKQTQGGTLQWWPQPHKKTWSVALLHRRLWKGHWNHWASEELIKGRMREGSVFWPSSVSCPSELHGAAPPPVLPGCVSIPLGQLPGKPDLLSHSKYFLGTRKWQEEPEPLWDTQSDKDAWGVLTHSRLS